MKKSSLFWIVPILWLVPLCPSDAGSPPGGAWNRLLPPDIFQYDETFSRRSTESENRAQKDQETPLTVKKIFFSDRSFEEVIDFLAVKGIIFTPLDKETELRSVVNQDFVGARGYPELLRDPNYTEVSGSYGPWLLIVSSASLHPVTLERINKTTIVFIRKMTPEEIQAAEKEKAAEPTTKPAPKKAVPAKPARKAPPNPK